MSTSAEVRRLTKSRTDRMIDGVCGGVAAYFNLDPTLVRIAWVLLTILGGSGILLYIAAMILLPKDPAPPPSQTAGAPPAGASRSNTTFWGVLLVIVGLFWLAGNLGLHFWHNWWGLSIGVVIPVLLILAGVGFLFGGRNSMTVSAAQSAAEPGAEPAAPAEPAGPARARLVRTRADKKIAGVCGGIGAYVQIDPVIVRLLFVMAGLASIGIMLILYIVLAIVLPLEPEQTPAAAVVGV
jgi:phage shock protein C